MLRLHTRPIGSLGIHLAIVYMLSHITKQTLISYHELITQFLYPHISPLLHVEAGPSHDNLSIPLRVAITREGEVEVHIDLLHHAETSSFIAIS